MDKAVVISSGRRKLDVSKSVAREDLESYQDVIFLEQGVAVFNEQMELLPLISDFLTYYGREHSDKSVVTYANNLRYLVQYLTKFNDFYKNSQRDECLLHVHASEVKEFFDYCRSDKDKSGKVKESLTSRTIANRDATYCHFFSYFLCNPPAGYRKLRQENPYEKGSLALGIKSSLIKPALFSDIEALVRVSHHEREKCLIQFMYDSGIRRAEVRSISYETIFKLSKENRKSIIEDEQTIRVPSEYMPILIEGNKGRARATKSRYTVVSKETINRVQKYHSSIEYKRHKRKWVGNPPAFLNQNGEPYTDRGVSKLINKLSVRAQKQGLLRTHISPHKIRHGFAAMVLNSEDLGKTKLDRLLLVQRCLGHTSLGTTEEYTKIPSEVWEKFVDIDGIELKRHQLMKKLKDRTRGKKGSSR